MSGKKSGRETTEEVGFLQGLGLGHSTTPGEGYKKQLPKEELLENGCSGGGGLKRDR